MFRVGGYVLGSGLRVFLGSSFRVYNLVWSVVVVGKMQYVSFLQSHFANEETLKKLSFFDHDESHYSCQRRSIGPISVIEIEVYPIFESISMLPMSSLHQSDPTLANPTLTPSVLTG